MTYQEAIQFLFELRLFGTKLGLTNTFQLALQSGNPHQKLRFIHVAGTNGKGSTCAMLESIYREAGLKVGLYTSPHLVSFTERMQINRRPIAEEEVVRLTEEIQRRIKENPPDFSPTFFEVVTVMALDYFAKERCDLVIWETGLGGRLDATNIVTPLASLITNIQLDHQQWLGQTRQQIAREKGGIIKRGALALTTETEPEIVQQLAEMAAEVGAPFIRVTAMEAHQPPLNEGLLPLLGEHQYLNAALAVATVRALRRQIPVSDAAIKAGLKQVRWPGRLQVVRRGIGRTLVLDGAHNPAGMETLRAGLERHFPGMLGTFVLGVLQDKDWEAMCQIMAPMAGRVLLAPVESQRTMEPQVLAETCRRMNLFAEVLVFRSIKEALQAAENDPFVVVTGSLHFIGEAMEALELAPSAAEPERQLNDWGAPAASPTLHK